MWRVLEVWSPPPSASISFNEAPSLFKFMVSKTYLHPAYKKTINEMVNTEIEKNQYEFKTAKNFLMAKIISSLYNISINRQRILIADTIIKKLKDLRDILGGLYEMEQMRVTGTLKRILELDAEIVMINSLKRNLNYEVYEDVFKISSILGIDTFTVMSILPGEITIDRDILNTPPELFIDSLPQLQKIRMEVNIARLNTQLAHLKRYPELTLGGGYMYMNPASKGMVPLMVYASITLPFLQGRKYSSLINASKIRETIQENQYEEEKRNILKEYYTLTNSGKSILNDIQVLTDQLNYIEQIKGIISAEGKDVTQYLEIEIKMLQLRNEILSNLKNYKQKELELKALLNKLP